MNEQIIIESLKEISDLGKCRVGDIIFNFQYLGQRIVAIYPHDAEKIELACGIRCTRDGKYNEKDIYPMFFTQNPYTYILEKFGNQERIVEVEISSAWYKRRLITILPNGDAICYKVESDKHYMDNIEKTNGVSAWKNWREVPTIPTFTKEQICKALNVEDFEIKD